MNEKIFKVENKIQEILVLSGADIILYVCACPISTMNSI